MLDLQCCVDFGCAAAGSVVHMCLHAQSLPLCLTLCSPMNYSTPPQGSSVHMLILGRILERAASFSSRGSSRPRDRAHVPPLQVDSLSLSHLGSPYVYMYLFFFLFLFSYRLLQSTEWFLHFFSALLLLTFRSF